MDNNGNESFKMTYSGKQQEEIKNIRSKYVSTEESTIDRIKRLDGNVTKKATVRSLILGIIGTLIMGIGMSFVMTEIGRIFGEGYIGMIVGCIIGIIGIAIVALAYPVYNGTLKNERKRIAPEIIRLTDELMK